ncbi:MAG: HPF/RaiA family ribosome-associated protein [Holosporaceae bacterium]|jgi:ribosomal subunit interface protein|nr:HPF/RaiA family ribosome-associated protein [Holosporaceae bacterium]
MSFSFSGRHMEIGESLTSKAKEACEALANKYGVEFISANVVMKKDGYLFCCDISVKTSCGNSYYASNEADDPKISFDVTLQKIDQQMQKKKKSERCSCKCRLEINNFDNSLDEQLEENSAIIIAEILEDLPLLSVSDAAKRLNEKTKVFVFENISNNAVNVVYIRPDENIGWIDYKVKR